MEAKKVLDIIDGADCNAEVCFVTSDKVLRPLGWAQKLVESSFKAGIKEVVECVNGFMVLHSPRMWQAKLKEWGIE